MRGRSSLSSLEAGRDSMCNLCQSRVLSGSRAGWYLACVNLAVSGRRLHRVLCRAAVLFRSSSKPGRCGETGG